MKENIYPSSLLHTIEHRSLSMPTWLKIRVCEELQWSSETYRDKLKVPDITDNRTGQITPALTDFERRKILAVTEEVLSFTEDFMMKSITKD